MTTKVVAIARGHDGSAVREEGEVFVLNLNDPRYAGSTWFVKVDEAPPPKAADPKKRPPGAGPAKGSAAKADDIA